MVNEPDDDFALRLVGDGISIEKRVNKRVAMAVVAAVLGDGAAVASPMRPPANVSSSSKPASSPREFLSHSGAVNNAQKITLLGYFICNEESKDSFSNDDLREKFRQAHEPIPKNVPRDLGVAIKAGWIHESPGKSGRYYITNTGMKQVEGKFGS
jgi:hypothetical protein